MPECADVFSTVNLFESLASMEKVVLRLNQFNATRHPTKRNCSCSAKVRAKLSKANASCGSFEGAAVNKVNMDP